MPALQLVAVAHVRHRCHRTRGWRRQYAGQPGQAMPKEPCAVRTQSGLGATETGVAARPRPNGPVPDSSQCDVARCSSRARSPPLRGPEGKVHIYA